MRPAADKPMMPLETVVAKDDANEKRNLENATKGLDAFNKHDTKAMGDMLADNATWSEIGAPKAAPLPSQHLGWPSNSFH